jgi:hypothetical protein
MASQTEFLKQAKILFDQEDYIACLDLLAPHLLQDAEAAALAEEARGKLEELRLREEWEVYLENLKKEAMDLFDREEYSESQEKFAFLSRQKPEDHTIQDYVHLCHQLLSEKQEAATETPTVAQGMAPTVDSSSPPLREQAVVTDIAGPKVSSEPAGELSAEDPGGGDQEKIEQSSQPEILPLPSSRRPLQILVSMLIVLTVIGIAGFWKFWQLAPSSLDIISEPEGADVWLNGELKGRTHLHLEPVETGTYSLKIEMPGYLTYTQQLLIGKRQPTSLSVKLARLPETLINPEEMLSTASVLYSQGKLMEALQFCDRILEKQPQNQEALDLKKRIFERLHPEQLGGENINSHLPPPGAPPSATSPPGASSTGTVSSGMLPPPASSQVRPASSAGTVALPSTDPRQVSAPLPMLPARGAISNNQPAQGINVIHRHFVGSCRGVLTLKGEEISFEPVGSSDEGFIRPYREIEKIEAGKSLKIQFKNKTFRFELADVSDEMDNRQKLVQISRQIMERMAETKR